MQSESSPDARRGDFVEAPPGRVRVTEPIVVRDVLSGEDLRRLSDSILGDVARNKATNRSFDAVSNRFNVWDTENAILHEIFEKATPLARRVFGSPALVPSYAMSAHYEGSASLRRHRDTNACTYTLDLCLYEKEPWDIWVEGKSYTLNPNEALAFYGNHQDHWRDAFPSPATNQVGMAFFHFVEPGHWYKTRSRDHLETIYQLQDILEVLVDPAQRMFVSILLQAWNAGDVYRFVRQAFPGEEPFDRVFSLVEQMCVAGGPFGFEVNRSTLRVARRYAEGWSTERIVLEVNATRKTKVTEADVQSLLDTLHGSVLTLLFP